MKAKHPGRWASAAAAIVAVLWVAGTLSHASPSSTGVVSPGTGTPKAGCIGVVVVSSQEKAGLVATLAAAYDRGNPTQNGTCVDVRVNPLASGSAETALTGDWHGTPGPAPTVWSPASTSWLTLLRFDRGAADLPDILPASSPNLMQSPLVLAMPKPMAVAMGWPNVPVGWSDILKLAQDPQGWGRYGHPEWGRFRLGKTSPVESTSGLHALIATYYAATGISADLTVADVTDPRVVAFVKGVEGSVLHYGNTVATFLDGLRAADKAGTAMAYVSAVATEETQVLSYDAAHPNTPLVAVYPKDGTLVADHPYAVLNSTWVSDEQRAAATAFLQWLLQPAQQLRFTAAGFRDHAGRASAALTVDDGIVPAGPSVRIEPPEPKVLALIRKSWADVRKRARLLLVIDTSGSMAGDKIAAVQKAAVRMVKAFSSDDELGFWTFSTQVDERVPVAPVGAGIDVIDQIEALQAEGSTALYRATDYAVTAMRQDWDPERINAVILLTDGQNDDGDQNLNGLLTHLRQGAEDRPVPVFTIAYGSDADLTTLEQISAAAHGRSYDAPDPNQVGAVFADVLADF